jgi:hypothetical protein
MAQSGHVDLAQTKNGLPKRQAALISMFNRLLHDLHDTTGARID